MWYADFSFAVFQRPCPWCEIEWLVAINHGVRVGGGWGSEAAYPIRFACCRLLCVLDPLLRRPDLLRQEETITQKSLV